MAPELRRRERYLVTQIKKQNTRLSSALKESFDKCGKNESFPKSTFSPEWQSLSEELCVRTWGHSGSARQTFTVRRLLVLQSVDQLFARRWRRCCVGQHPLEICCHFLMQLRSTHLCHRVLSTAEPGVRAYLCSPSH